MNHKLGAYGFKEFLVDEDIKQKMNDRKSSRTKRQRKNTLRFIPGVNYAPGMYYMNHMKATDEHGHGNSDDCSVKVEPKLKDYIDNFRQEYKQSKLDESKLEHMIMEMRASVQDIENVPQTFREAVTGPEKDKWLPAIKSEWKSLIKREVWRKRERPHGKHLVDTKWCFRKKVKADGSIRFKARLVARGFTQIEGEDFFETYAPTLSLGSLRLLIAIASRYKLNIDSIDIETAYLYGDVDAEIP